MVAPTSDLAPLDSLPASSRGLALQSADHLQDTLRWTLGRFGRLQDVEGLAVVACHHETKSPLAEGGNLTRGVSVGKYQEGLRSL